MRKKQLELLRKFLVENYEGKQTFSTRNIVGDEMHNVYADEDITVDYCYDYEYLEIFGLTREEYLSLSDILDIC